MESYTSFAKVYDTFMDNVPYEEWGTYLHELLKEYGVEDGLILDLACGTGSLTRLLAHKGYDMIGVDYSQEMLQIAMDKAEQDHQDILYLAQDMREFELYGTVKAVVSICDSINYITEDKDLKTVFELVNNYLDPQGIFIFDLNTIFKYEEQLGENTFAESREDCSFIWDNYYDEIEQINEYQLTLFVEDEETSMYQKMEEIHYQKAYTLERIKQLLEEAGMEFLVSYDAFTRDSVKEDSERIYIIARESGKQNK